MLTLPQLPIISIIVIRTHKPRGTILITEFVTENRKTCQNDEDAARDGEVQQYCVPNFGIGPVVYFPRLGSWRGRDWVLLRWRGERRHWLGGVDGVVNRVTNSVVVSWYRIDRGIYNFTEEE